MAWFLTPTTALHRQPPSDVTAVKKYIYKKAALPPTRRRRPRASTPNLPRPGSEELRNTRTLHATTVRPRNRSRVAPPPGVRQPGRALLAAKRHRAGNRGGSAGGAVSTCFFFSLPEKKKGLSPKSPVKHPTRTCARPTFTAKVPFCISAAIVCCVLR